MLKMLLGALNGPIADKGGPNGFRALLGVLLISVGAELVRQAATAPLTVLVDQLTTIQAIQPAEYAPNLDYSPEPDADVHVEVETDAKVSS